ncbi:protein mom-5-like [Clytia hemisphaerica]|uniref:FZ domain-containing protein n=1 Tax=Clytia hemisphaerica TaxID=252671 RepID=A0A7M5V4U3_9CNID
MSSHMFILALFGVLLITQLVNGFDNNLRMRNSRYCQSIDVGTCRFSSGSGYANTFFPSNNYRTQEEAEKDLAQYKPLIKIGCHRDAALFLCSHYVPLCIEEMKVTLKPCRSLCESVKNGCGGLMAKFGYEWQFDCSKLPGSGQACVAGQPEVTTTSAATTASGVFSNVTTQVTTTRKTKPNKGGKTKKKRGKATGEEGKTVEIKCKKGQSISIRKVVHKDSKCCAHISKQILEVLCDGRKGCRFDVTKETFGGHCFNQVGSILVKYRCEKNIKDQKRENLTCPVRR